MALIPLHICSFICIHAIVVSWIFLRTFSCLSMVGHAPFFICVYFLSPSEQITIAFQKLAQQSNPLLHYILCYEHSVLRGGDLRECSSFLALLLPCPSVSVSSFLSVPTEPCNYRWMPSYSPLSTPLRLSCGWVARL